MSIKAITLDYWDTIFKMENEFDPKTYRLERMKSLLKKIEVDLSEEKLNNLYKEVWQKFDFDWHHNHRTWQTSEIINYMLNGLGITLEKTAFESLVEYFQNAILESPPDLMDNVKNAIEKLSKKYKLGIISDTGFTPGIVLRKILQMNGIDKYFSVLIFSDEFGTAKPNPNNFNFAAEKLGVELNQLLHIGDNERTDILGASNAGAKSILFFRNKPELLPASISNAVMTDWKEIEEIIGKIDN